MSFVLCGCGAVTSNRITMDNTCQSCGKSNWVEADDMNLEAIYWKDRATIVGKQAIQFIKKHRKCEEKLSKAIGVLRVVQAFHDIHEVRTNDCVTGEEYLMDSKLIDRVLEDIDDIKTI